MFKLEFETLNAGVQSPEEIARIIKHVGQKVANCETEGRIRDNNGNTIGEWSWSQRIENLTEACWSDIGTRKGILCGILFEGYKEEIQSIYDDMKEE